MKGTSKLIAILSSVLFMLCIVSSVSAFAVEPEDLTNVVVRDVDGDVVTVKWDPITNCWRCFKEDGRESIHSGLAPNENGMWYCSIGRVMFDYTNFVQFEGDTWYVKDGKVATDFTGELANGNMTYLISSGKLVDKYSASKRNAQEVEQSQQNFIKGGLILILFLGGIIAFILVSRRKAKTPSKTETTYATSMPHYTYTPPLTEKETKEYSSSDEAIYSSDEKYQKYQYRRKDTLTNREKSFYQELLPIADKLGFSVWSKTRVGDLVDAAAPSYTQEAYASWAKVRSKHVDFVLVDRSTLDVKLLIELDDSSHQRADRKERDEFVDYVYRTTGYPILHVYSSYNLENQIRTKLGI